MRRIFILIKRVYYLFPRALQGGSRGNQTPRCSLTGPVTQVEGFVIRVPAGWLPLCTFTSDDEKIWLSLAMIEIHRKSSPCCLLLSAFMIPAMRQREPNKHGLLPFHSFKVTLGGVLWAPTQITLDELLPSHFIYITAPHHIPRRRSRREIRRGPHTECHAAKWQRDSGGVTRVVSSMSWQRVPLSCTV